MTDEEELAETANLIDEPDEPEPRPGPSTRPEPSTTRQGGGRREVSKPRNRREVPLWCQVASTYSALDPPECLNNQASCGVFQEFLFL
ncbi:hypothetical protein Pcinc_004288 [Petrolisthes cinctipes]|uniref:Uncharacterized protein n=1 Tax=Petrolisthes cinctipes TaxID=88211 RepID=A0AAE1L180_PETCI|nr:hypothetical protein Pcinc_004288 [Petrolisthes cinctipes]